MLYLNYLYFLLYTFLIDIDIDINIDIHQLLAFKEKNNRTGKNQKRCVYLCLQLGNFLGVCSPLLSSECPKSCSLSIFARTILFCLSNDHSVVHLCPSPSTVPWAAALRPAKSQWESCLLWGPCSIHSCFLPMYISSSSCTSSQDWTFNSVDSSAS